MDEMKFTSSQNDALNVIAPKILVSAAAGSGKSTVLTERIIRSLTRENNPSDISNLMVVTFTRSASEELKIKISKSIRSRLNENPDNKRLSEQLLKLSSAKISTIHGLCYSLIKSDFARLNLNPSMRVLDETESLTLKNEIMDSMIESAYAGLFMPIPDFRSFSENFITNADDKLASIFLSMYSSIKNETDGFADFENSIKALSVSTLEKGDIYSKILCDDMVLFCDYSIKMYENAIEYFNTEEPYKSAYTPMFSKILDFLKELKKSAESSDYFEVRKTLSLFPKGNLGQVKAVNKTDEGEFFKDLVHAKTKDKIKSYINEYFCFSKEDIIYLRDETVKISKYLLAFLKEFDKRYSENKLYYSVLDFNDLEHYAIKLLSNKDGTPTETAVNISNKLDEIYVDEYQDVNPLQNKIFECLSCKTSIFMVGDIKQSIYSFRGAMPEIFANYRREFNTFDKDSKDNDLNKTVFLSDNFRSESNITEFVNTVSDAVFKTPENNKLYSYRIPYSVFDRLNPNKKTENAPVPEILVTDISAFKEERNPDKEELSAVALEAETVAERISEILKNNDVKPDEIAILLRSTKSKGAIFENALRKRHIPVNSEKGSSLFDNPEVQIALSVLNVIDNPYRDIYLAASLRSPLFAITLSELIEIRREADKNTPLFDALCAYTEKHKFEKGIRFLSFINTLREYATNHSVDRVLWRIYNESSLFTLIYDNEKVPESIISARKSNLIALHSFAVEFASNSANKSLYAFLMHIQTMIINNVYPDKTVTSSKGVKILSIHKSKGLEFKHCFLADTSSSLNKKDSRENIIYDSKFGLGMKIKDELKLTSSESPYRLALSLIKKRQTTDEEMRILYVALSRAKYALYVSASERDFSKTDRCALMFSKCDHPETYISKNRYIDWILTALHRKTDLCPRYEIKTVVPDCDNCETFSDEQIEINELDINSDEYKNIQKQISSKLSFIYPYLHSSKIPSKLSVSRLYPEILDEPDFSDTVTSLDISDTKEENEKNNESNMKVPDFIIKSQDKSAAKRGTATHIFMQFCNFDNVVQNGIENEIERLIRERFILKEHGELISRKYLNNFFKSDIFNEMKNARKLSREYRFNIKLPAYTFTSANELKKELKDDFIFVQGVIDCYFISGEGKMVLLDYKTDKVPYDIKGDYDKENEFFKNRHGLQLNYYKSALERLTGKEVDETLIYSFDLNRCINL